MRVEVELPGTVRWYGLDATGKKHTVNAPEVWLEVQVTCRTALQAITVWGFFHYRFHPFNTFRGFLPRPVAVIGFIQVAGVLRAIDALRQDKVGGLWSEGAGVALHIFRPLRTRKELVSFLDSAQKVS